jgi:hypothetical protein
MVQDRTIINIATIITIITAVITIPIVCPKRENNKSQQESTR